MRRLLVIGMLLFVSAGTLWASAENDELMVETLRFNELPNFAVSPGEVLYKRYCLFCHGEFGAGDGQNAYNLPTKPASFLNTIFRAKTPQQAQELIVEGGSALGQSQAMPSFKKTLSFAQIRAIVTYIKNLKASPENDEAEDFDEL